MVPRVEVGWRTAQLGRGMGNWIRERRECRVWGPEVPRCQPPPRRYGRAGPSPFPLDSGESPRGSGAGRYGSLTGYREGFQARTVGSDPRARPHGSPGLWELPLSLTGSVGPTAGSRPGWHLNPPAVPPVCGRDCRVTSCETRKSRLPHHRGTCPSPCRQPFLPGSRRFQNQKRKQVLTETRF